jgi:hypothetical protein
MRSEQKGRRYAFSALSQLLSGQACGALLFPFPLLGKGWRIATFTVALPPFYGGERLVLAARLLSCALSLRHKKQRLVEASMSSVPPHDHKGRNATVKVAMPQPSPRRERESQSQGQSQSHGV